VTLNVVVEWFTLLLRVLVVPGLNLILETGYADRLFVVFLSPSKKTLWYYLKIRPRQLPSTSFLIYHSLIIFYSTLYSLSYWLLLRCGIAQSVPCTAAIF
jgi:hypothetical protein